MNKKAFTLIEVMVVVAIISIMASMMMPAVWKWWENEEIATTRQRLKDLKDAMVGDRTLAQNGVRTHYGFVGDNGELPFGNISTYGGLKYLQENYNSVYPRWSGPYLKGGFDPSSYMLDAWGNKLVYSPVQVPPGDPNRYVYGEIRSYGPNGIANDSDDIVELIAEQEVTPTSKLLGTIPTNLVQTVVTGYSASIQISYPDATAAGGIRTFSECRNIPPSFAVYSAVHYQKLPIAKVWYKSEIYTSPDCAGTLLSKLESYYFLGDSAKQLPVEFHP